MMARTIIDQGKEYEVYSDEFSLEAGKQAQRAGKDVLFSHSCPSCGAELFSSFPGSTAACETHSSRFYMGDNWYRRHPLGSAEE